MAGRAAEEGGETAGLVLVVVVVVSAMIWAGMGEGWGEADWVGMSFPLSSCSF